MKITALVENTSVNENIDSEHGLSLYIESCHYKILFDMGQTTLFKVNADKLGVDLSRVDIAVLSHGHYDHGGGLKEFLDINNTAPVYLSKYAFEPHYNGTEKYIGLDTSLANNSRLIYTDEIMKINDNLTLFSCNDCTHKFELGSFGLNMKVDDEFIPDDFRHEQYLMIREDNKKVLISGCSHKGILNIVNWFEADVIIGGFHFSKLPLDENLQKYADYLNSFHTEFITCHCTGLEQFEFMKKSMSNLRYISAGQTIEI